MSSKAKIYLYKEGNECTTLTGGWIKGGFNIGNGVFTKKLNNILFEISGANQGISLCQSNTINLAKYSSVNLDVDYNTNQTEKVRACLYLNTKKGITSTGTDIISSYTKEAEIKSPGKHTLSVDVNAFTDDIYVFSFLNHFSSANSSSSSSLVLHNAYLETKENVISINSQNNSSINFNCNTFDNLIVITKAEIYINGALSKTYTSNFDNITYDIDKNLCTIGVNNIKIKVTYSQGDDIYETVEEVLTHTNTVNNLPTSSSLKELIDRQELLTNSIEVQKNTLKSILESKNVEVSEEENKMSILIDKVEELKEDDSIAWLFKDGNEKVSFEILGNGITINKFNFVGSGACSSKKVSVNTINLTEYKTLKVEYGDCTTTKGNYYPVIGFGIATTKQAGDNHLASKTSNASSSQFNNANSIVILDISSFNGDYYIDIFVNSYANASLNINIKNIWLEK